ncbi:fas-associated factor [Anaeramoeba flamelloides]|uniref:Fas-associated factor n=1 Tax=Anaeramoeba flamelloides TaxID=1746091 RepID=A0AAV7YYW6_9EUKA|nr:fas-associated factor [Anaeramoeba flamelloides]
MTESIQLTIKYGELSYDLSMKQSQTFNDVKAQLTDLLKIPIEQISFSEVKITDASLPLFIYDFGEEKELTLVQINNKEENEESGKNSSEFAWELQQRLYQEEISTQNNNINTFFNNNTNNNNSNNTNNTNNTNNNTSNYVNESNNNSENVQNADEILSLKELKEIAPPTLGTGKFLKDFESKYGTDHVKFSELGFSEWRRKHKSTKHLKIIYLHQSKSGEMCENFINDILKDTAINVIISEHCTVWAGCADEMKYEDDLEELKEILGVEDQFPFFGIFSSGKPSILLEKFVYKYPSAGSIHNKILNLYFECKNQTNSTNLEQQLQNLKRRTSSLMIKLDQDREYNKTLELDREKLRLEKLVKEHLERKEFEQNILKINQEKEIEKKKKKFETEPSGENTVQILFRSPKGEKIRRKFLPQDPFEYLFLYVESVLTDIGKFKLVQNYPMKEYFQTDEKTLKKTLKELDIQQSMFLIRNLD